jgi:hypothetical protein
MPGASRARRPTRRRPNRTEITVAVALILLALLGLWVKGIGPFARTPAGPAEGNQSGQTFDQAAATALSLANSTERGPWSAGLAIGIEMGSALPLRSYWGALVAHLGGSLCRLSDFPSAAWNETVSGFSGSRLSGQSPAWVVAVTNRTEVGYLILVTGGGASILGSFGGSQCANYASQVGQLPPDFIDSPAAVSTALQAGGLAFLATNPGANLSMWAPTTSPSESSNETGWMVSLSTCPLVASWSGLGTFGPFPGATFAAFVDISAGVASATVYSSDFSGCSITGLEA